MRTSEETATTIPLKSDPSLLPAYSLRSRLTRLLWPLCYVLPYSWSPRPFHAWRAFLLRAFGAKLGPTCHFYPKGNIWAPWNLACEDRVTLADDAEISKPSPLYLGSHCIVSPDPQWHDRMWNERRLPSPRAAPRHVPR